MSSRTAALVQWYHDVKSDCTCLACERNGPSKEPDKIEFHHVNPKTKVGTISHLMRAGYSDVAINLEWSKVVPLCHIHHNDLHWSLSNNLLYYLEHYAMTADPFYQEKRLEFCRKVNEKQPGIRHYQL